MSGEGKKVIEHGGPFDRGWADYYYWRIPAPHYWTKGSYRGIRVEAKDMTPEEIADYEAGYAAAEEAGDRKRWD